MMYIAMTCLWWSAAETAGVSEALSVMDMYCQDSRQKEIATRKSSALEDVTSIHLDGTIHVCHHLPCALQEQQHLPNVDTRFHCPQVFLRLDFHCRDDGSRMKADILGFGRVRLSPCKTLRVCHQLACALQKLM